MYNNICVSCYCDSFMVGHPVVKLCCIAFICYTNISKENIMTVFITATLNDDGSVSIVPSPDYFNLNYEIAVGFISELKIELEDTIVNLEYTNLLV